MKADFSTYKSIFTIPFYTNNEEYLEGCIKNSIYVTIGLAMYTKILGKTYSIKNLKKLIKNDKAILLSALLLKIAILINSFCPLVQLVDPNEADYSNFKNAVKREDPYNKTLAITSLHAISGCIPNVHCCAGHGNRFIACAITPIKAGDKIIDNSRSGSIWTLVRTCDRQSHKNLYGFPCECQACTGSWSDYFYEYEKFKTVTIFEMSNPDIMNLWDERDSILSEWKANCHKPSFPDIKMLSRTINLVTTVSRKVSLPSLLLLRSVLLLVKMLEAFHDPSEIYTKVRDLRIQELDSIPNPKVYQLTDITSTLFV
ncbi:hypothetical protein QAD02_011360 [Eretmocerus hayati]|uniref:Uncharacterized protein n=1 Tax=Eretmocerus hayati TaxID=131215 RepID=A0ACC2NZ54_9HYME|nr:hypothetical protein QAD02_011360 [Eretmocerus hayati]